MRCRVICLIFLFANLRAVAQVLYQESFRPQIHFSPAQKWMNDPNGMVYYQNVYHLFFQYYPDSTVWGPMHWGHATSKDLLHWKEQPIALFPDSLGYIFSGSSVVDSNNTSGFGRPGQIPLVAIFTQHDPVGEQRGNKHFQNQSIAYSLDAGKTWTKYNGNPVLRSPELADFRDPKVFWYSAQKKWIMTLAAGDRLMFYSSVNLKIWNKESEFGLGIGAHGGVWECPDLFPLMADGTDLWCLLVSTNPGGAQGGSSTQYFTGSFNGHQFSPSDTKTRWADTGPDNYAGVTWSNTGNKKIFLGWMSNWQYGTRTPTVKWRSAMTIPRELGLKKIGTQYFLTMRPVKAFESLVEKKTTYPHIHSEKKYPVSDVARIDCSIADLHSFQFLFYNAAGEKLSVGYDEDKKAFFIDRRLAGISSFDSTFAKIHFAPRLAKTKDATIILVLDHSSLELFADDGLTTMTEIFFPSHPFQQMQVHGNTISFHDLKVSELRSVWHK